MAGAGNRGSGLLTVYSRLLACYGTQGWWPLLRKSSGGWYSDYSPENLVREKTELERFEICLGAILTQNTSWKNAEKALINLREADLIRPGIHRRLEAEELARYIRPSGYYNQKAGKILLFSRFRDDLSGAEDSMAPGLSSGVCGVPGRRELLGIRGIGPETADDMLLYAFDRPEFVIDAYTLRLFSRLGLWPEGGDGLKEWVEAALGPDVRLYKEFHGLIVNHAKVYCRKRPLCGEGCPLLGLCACGQEGGFFERPETSPGPSE